MNDQLAQIRTILAEATAATGDPVQDVATLAAERDELRAKLDALMKPVEGIPALTEEQREVLQAYVNGELPYGTVPLMDLCQLALFADSAIKRAETAKAEAEQLRVQQAGVSVAALGGTKEPVAARRGDYGWSVAYQDTLDLRLKYEQAEVERDAALEQLQQRTAEVAMVSEALREYERLRMQHCSDLHRNTCRVRLNALLGSGHNYQPCNCGAQEAMERTHSILFTDTAQSAEAFLARMREEATAELRAQLKAQHGDLADVTEVLDEAGVGHLEFKDHDETPAERVELLVAQLVAEKARGEELVELRRKATMAKPLIIYHGNCTDGWTAAWIMYHAFDGEVDLHAGFYGQSPPNVSGRDVFIVDFSYPHNITEMLIAEANYVTILDHHKTAEAEIKKISERMRARASITFDLTRSGARLAYDWALNQPMRTIGCVLMFARYEHASKFIQGIEPFVNYVQDRDLWQWKLPNSRLVSAAIERFPKTIDAWNELVATPILALVDQGVVIEGYRKICIEAAKNLARKAMIGGHLVPCANSSEMRFASDTAHELSIDEDFGATWWLRNDGVAQFSLRSDENGIDVSEIAKQYGGGGHQHAAGFQVPFNEVGKILNL